MSCTSLWYWAKAPSSLDCSIVECFLALSSSSPVIRPGALCRHTPGAYQTSVGISPRHPAVDNIRYSSTQLLWKINYSMGTVTYIHPLPSLAHRLQVARYCHRGDKIICQKFEPVTTSRCGLRHRCPRTTTSMLVFGSASSCTSSVTSGAAVSAGSDAAPVVTSASGTTSLTGTASGIAVPSTCAPDNTRHMVLVPGGYDYYLG
jgi:hypothetical protein